MRERLLTSLITALAISGLPAQTLPPVPKLVVGLTIDQLRADYMEAFSPLYGEKGFKRLWKEGRAYIDAEYGFAAIDKASALAAVYTGAMPGINGIIAENWIDRATGRAVDCVEDPGFMGIYTDEATSAAAVLSSTLTDELKAGTQGRAYVYSIAPSREAAVIAAGHAGDGAFWLNDATGKWCGTTYYSEFPYWLTRYNDEQGVDKRIGDRVWEPLLPAEKYVFLSSEWRQDYFRHVFKDFRGGAYREFKTSPFVNEEVNRVAAECLCNSPMGEDDVPDFLALSYYAGNYAHKSVMEAPMELQDAYVRLDRSLAELLDLIDQEVGLRNTLFFIVSTGYADADAQDLAKYRIPSGQFYPERCAALLNMYLNAIYGEGLFVEAYHGSQIYLDHEVIEKKQLDLPEVIGKSADFLIQFSGVNEVYTAYRLLLGAWTPEVYRVRNAFHRERSGDLWVDVLPGWTVVQEKAEDTEVVRKSCMPAPLLFFGWDVKPGVVRTPVNISRLAPSVAGMMRIRAPNACSARPLEDMQANKPVGLP